MNKEKGIGWVTLNYEKNVDEAVSYLNRTPVTHSGGGVLRVQRATAR